MTPADKDAVRPAQGRHIPRVIHYCWFGHAPLPASAERCIASWRRFLPDCDICRWDEDNYDVRACPYTAAAYDAGLYAFVSDYARFDILEREGGIYFDTDVEAIAPFDDLLARGAFMGRECQCGVNAGLGMAAPAGLPVFQEILEYYRALAFYGPDGRRIPGTVVGHVTGIMARHGLRPAADLDAPVLVAGVWVYPNDYFNPYDSATGRLNLTPRTRSIHHYACTWLKDYSPLRRRLSQWAHRLFGTERVHRLFRGAPKQ